MNPHNPHNPHTPTAADVLLLLDAVIDDLMVVRDRNSRPGRLAGPDVAASIAGQIRTLNGDCDPFSLGVRGCLDAVAGGLEAAARQARF